jgi:DNA-directed RNA polymerase specialized sigma24 family protein
LANVNNISNYFRPFTSAESENLYHALEQKLISKILEIFKTLIGQEPSESLTTIVRSTCCDYLRSLLFRLKPLLLLEKTNPDPLTALVKQVAWEYIGNAKENNALAKDRLVPPPLTGRSPANLQQMDVYLLSKLDVPERQAVLLNRFRDDGITDRDIARHININVEALEDLHLSAEKKMNKDDTQWQDTRKTKEKILSETDFIEDFDNTWSKPVEAFATLMLGDPRHVSRISGAVLEKSLCSRAQFNTDAAWEGHEKWPGFRQLTADACRDFIIKFDKKPAEYEKASLWQKCLATLTVDEYRCLMLSTFFYKRDDTTDICAIVNKFKYPNTRTKAYSQNKVQSHIQAALKKILERSQEV